MERRRGSAEVPHDGAPATPRPAASVVLLRRGGKHSQRALEVLLLKRSEAAAFMPGVWVFAGGSVEPSDGEGPDGYRACARHILFERGGSILLDCVIQEGQRIPIVEQAESSAQHIG